MPNKKIQKALCKLNGFIDDDHQRLCDRIKLLEKSHKRLMNLLYRSLSLIEDGAYMYDSEGYYKTRDEMFCFIKAVQKEINRKVL